MVVAQLFKSSVGRKIIMALTGLFLCLFLAVHLAGNLLLLKNDGGVTFNHYAFLLEGNSVIWIIEWILVLVFGVHIGLALFLSFQNKEARPVRSAVNRPWETSDFSSRTMGVTGSIVFLFLVVHLWNFTVNQRFLENYGSMYEAVKATLRNPYYALFYGMAIFWVGVHLKHGFQSAFQSLGLSDGLYTAWFKVAGTCFAVLVSGGFIFLAFYIYFYQFWKG